ncbi:HAD family hydrolase [Brevibacillus daliensis]|uniref:HAD family hydrolase n=1 Tax=Brevibacillus daliensis TaxID=2892995 RepID=UPI001E4E233D|nr:HAD family hydrolase [Brevibacillus daliensis]
MKNLSCKIVAFDMDGTLLNGESKMAEATKEACLALQAQGVKLVLSTGRPYRSACVAVDNFKFDGYVCSNGSAIFNADGELMQYKSLDGALVVDIIEKVRHSNIYYEAHDQSSFRWMVEEDKEKIKEMLMNAGSLERVSTTEFNNRTFSFTEMATFIKKDELVTKIKSGEFEISKMFFWHSDPTMLAWLREQAINWEGKMALTSSGPHNVEIMPVNMNKWVGLQYFMKEWSVPREETAAFGDEMNDFEILSEVGIPIVMENGNADLKKLTKYIAKHHCEDGVACFIREHLLG